MDHSRENKDNNKKNPERKLILAFLKYFHIPTSRNQGAMHIDLGEKFRGLDTNNFYGFGRMLFYKTWKDSRIFVQSTLDKFQHFISNCKALSSADRRGALGALREFIKSRGYIARKDCQMPAELNLVRELREIVMKQRNKFMTFNELNKYFGFKKTDLFFKSIYTHPKHFDADTIAILEFRCQDPNYINAQYRDLAMAIIKRYRDKVLEGGDPDFKYYVPDKYFQGKEAFKIIELIRMGVQAKENRFISYEELFRKMSGLVGKTSILNAIKGDKGTIRPFSPKILKMLYFYIDRIETLQLSTGASYYVKVVELLRKNLLATRTKDAFLIDKKLIRNRRNNLVDADGYAIGFKSWDTRKTQSLILRMESGDRSVISGKKINPKDGVRGHISRDKSDCRLSNLAWISRGENGMMEVEDIIYTPRGRMPQRDYFEIILKEAKERLKLGLAPKHWDLVDQKEFEKERKSMNYLDAFL